MEKNKYPKILVGGPVSDHHDYCYLQFLETVKRLSYPNFDVFLYLIFFERNCERLFNNDTSEKVKGILNFIST